METIKDDLLKSVEVLMLLSATCETCDASRLEDAELRGLGHILRSVWGNLLRDHDILDMMHREGRI